MDIPQEPTPLPHPTLPEFDELWNTIKNYPRTPLSFIPKNLALQKPVADAPRELIETLLQTNQGVGSKKFNGFRVHLLVTEEREVQIYQRESKKRLDGHVPQLVRAVQSLDLPPSTFLDAECFIPSEGGVMGEEESLEALQAVLMTGTPKEGAKVENQTPPSLALFDCVAYNGRPIQELPYRLRRAALPSTAPNRIHTVELFHLPDMATAEDLIRLKKWEGLVVWDLAASHKLNHNGNTKRWGAYKVKLADEEDLVAYAFKEGKGAGAGLVGTLLVGKYRSDGTIEPYGEVGSGLSLADKKKFTDPSQYPFVVAVRHFGRDNEGRVRLPTIHHIHYDKAPKECQVGTVS
jgi:ATP-dependent DNA ligase